MARTPLFGMLKRAYQIARLANRHNAPSAPELVGIRREAVSRRQFMKSAAAASTLAGSSLLTTGCPSTDAMGRVVIVGGGIAGLNAAFTLKKAGIRAKIYEASTRAGGRMWTARDLMGFGLTTELGGEFIDTGHKEMRLLAHTFDLELLDTTEPAESALINDAYYFNDQFYTEEQIIEAFEPLAPQIDSDFALAGDFDYTDANPFAIELDNLTLAEYLDQIGATGFLRELLDVAYVTEFGLATEEQSPFNLIWLIGTDTSDGFKIFGDSDERFKVKGGNQLIVDRLAECVENQIYLEHRLEAISRQGEAYVLHFDGPNGENVDVVADTVIMTIPFSILRNVDIQFELPVKKFQAIQELGYGTNAKLILGFDTRIWRDQGLAGGVFTDLPFQLCWDSSRMQLGEQGSLTLYSGGALGVSAGDGTPAERAAEMLPELEKVFPGTTNEFNDLVTRFHWPTFPFALGSYACYKPGQVTGFGGAEIERVDRLFFAGEHTSIEYQGYMNGGAATGKLAAINALKLAGLSHLLPNI